MTLSAIVDSKLDKGWPRRQIIWKRKTFDSITSKEDLASSCAEYDNWTRKYICTYCIWNMNSPRFALSNPSPNIDTPWPSQLIWKWINRFSFFRFFSPEINKIKGQLNMKIYSHRKRRQQLYTLQVVSQCTTLHITPNCFGISVFTKNSELGCVWVFSCVNGIWHSLKVVAFCFHIAILWRFPDDFSFFFFCIFGDSCLRT